MPSSPYARRARSTRRAQPCTTCRRTTAGRRHRGRSWRFMRTDPRRIAMVAQSYYVRDPRVRRAAETLAQSGFEVDFIGMRPEGSESDEVINGVNVHRLPLERRRGDRIRYLYEYAAFFALAFWRLSIRQLSSRYSLVYVHTLPDALVFATLVPRLLGARVFLDMHDPMPETFQSKYELTDASFIVRILLAIESIAVRYAHVVITVHEPLREVFISRGGNAAKIKVVMNLTDTSGPEWQGLAARRSYANGDTFVALYTGT